MIDNKKMRANVIRELEFYGNFLKLEANMNKKLSNLQLELEEGYGSQFAMSTSGHIKTDERVVFLIDRIEQEEKQLRKYRLRKDFIDEALKQIDDDEYKMIKELYIWGKSVTKYGVDHHLDRSTVFRRKTHIIDKLAMLLFPEEFFVLDMEDLEKEIHRRMRSKREL